MEANRRSERNKTESEIRLTKKYIDKFVKKPVKNKQGQAWIKKQRILKKR